MKKAKLSFMLLRPKLLRFIGTSLLSYIWVAAAISVTPASAADEIDFRNHSSKELITNQTELKNKLPDLQEVLAKNAEAERTIKSLIEQKQPLIIIIGQTDTPSPADNSQIDAGKLRQDLLIEPLIKVIPGKRTYSPSLTFATPSAFGATWGDVFLGASLATQGKTRNQPDASITMGFGLGDAQKLIGLELAYNIGSIKNFGANGTFDLKANRIVYAKNNTQVAAAVGWRTFAQHVDGETIRPSGVFGLVTSYSLLKPKDPVNKMPISFSVGAGGGDFRTGNTSTGVFAGVGVQVHPQIGVGMGWSGVGLNAGASFIPVRTIPLTINAMGADLTDTSRGGTVFVLSVGYGFNFLPK